MSITYQRRKLFLILTATLFSQNLSSAYTSVINSGETSTNEIINGDQYINAGGTAVNSNINGGHQVVSGLGAVANDAVITNGYQSIYNGGVANNTTVANVYGTQNVGNGGFSFGTTVDDVGTQIVFNGGDARDNTILEQSWQYVEGYAEENKVSHAFQEVKNDGKSKNNTIEKGSWQNIFYNGTANENTITGASGQRIDGVNAIANNSTFTDKSWQDVREGTANINIFESDSWQNVFVNGVANDNTIKTSARQEVQGGIANDTTVELGGRQNVDSGLANKNTIYGLQVVKSGGTIKDTTTDGGISYLHGGGLSQGFLNIQNNGTLVTNATLGTSKTIDNISIDSTSNMTIINTTGSTPTNAALSVGALSNNGALNLNGFYSLDGATDTTNPDSTFTTLNADHFSGNGNIFFHTDIAQIRGDLIQINTLSTTASQIIHINNNGALATNGTERLTLVKTNSGGASSQFTLATAVEAGGFQYGLRQTNGNKDWELYNLKDNNGNTIITSTADAGANSIVSSYLANLVDTQTLLHRIGELRTGSNTHGVWGRIYAGKIDANGKALLNGFNLKYASIQLGSDIKLSLDHGNLYLGGAISYFDSTHDYSKRANALATFDAGSAGSGKLKMYSVALYGTYIHENDFYVDVLLKYSHIKNNFKVRDSDALFVQSTSKANAFSGSVEIGKKFYFNQDKTNFYLTPQIQLTYTKFGSNRFNATNGLKIKTNDHHSLLGRAGLEFGYSFQSSNPMNVYMRTSYLKEFSGNSGYLLNTKYESHSLKDQWWQFTIGINAQIKKQHNIYANIDYNRGHYSKQKQINIGYRFEF